MVLDRPIIGVGPLSDLRTSHNIFVDAFVWGGFLGLLAYFTFIGVVAKRAIAQTYFYKNSQYQPDYPRRFENYAHALQWCEDYVAWYNHEHHHSSLAGYTPEQVFTGEHKALAKVRQAALDSAFREHPERFANGAPRTSMPPEEVFINPVLETDENATLNQGVNFPTLPRAIEKQFN